MHCVHTLPCEQTDLSEPLTIHADPKAWPDIKSRIEFIESDILELYGFSKDSKVAYMYYLARTECDDCSVLDIFDLRTNKVLKSHFFSAGTERTPMMIERILQTHGIERNQPLQLMRMPIKSIDGEVAVEFEPSDSDHFETWYNHVYVTSEELGKQKVGSVRKPGFWSSDPRAAKVVGMVKSPYEPLGLLIVAFPAFYPGDSFIGGIALQVLGAPLQN
jgi:hypothetical protein